MTELTTAALFAVATALGVHAASAVTVTRTLGPPPTGSRPSRRKGQIIELLEAAVEAIRAAAA